MVVSAGRAGRRIAIAFAFCVVCLLHGGAAMAASSAVVVMYHRFGESAYPTTNVTIEQFRSHLEEIRSGKYVIKPLPEIARELRINYRQGNFIGKITPFKDNTKGEP